MHLDETKLNLVGDANRKLCEAIGIAVSFSQLANTLEVAYFDKGKVA